MKHRSLIAIAASATLLLAACGDDDDDTAATDAPVATAAAADTTEAAAATTEAAAATTEAAAATTEAAAATTEAAAATTEAAAATTEAAAATTEAAAATTEASAGTTEAMGTMAMAAETTEAAAATTEAAATETTGAPETTAATEATTAGTEPTGTEPTGTEPTGTEPTGSVPVVGTGPECASLPDFGDGALAELADDTMGVAISNNLETSTFQTFLGRAELLEALDGEGPFTVFAPRNGAFVDIPENVYEAITNDPDLLSSTLSYHVVAGEALTSEDLATAGTATSQQGADLSFALDGDVLTINDGQATVICGDIPVANGTLFIVDQVLTPATDNAAGGASSVPGSSTPMAPATTEATESTEPTESTESTEAAATETTAAEGGEETASGITFPVTPGEDWPESIVFTLTPSQEAGGLIETAEPLAAMLAERLGIGVEAIVPTDYAGVIVALQSGQAQVAGGLGPLQMVQAEDEAGAELVLQSERFGSFEYVTQWYTNDPDTFCDDAPVADEDGMLFCNGILDAAGPSDGPIGDEHLADVAGQTVAFVDQGSASGYLVPALQLLNAGVDPTTGITANFAGGHDSAVQAVYDGDATVGVSFADARGQLVEQLPDVGEKVVVFAWSFPIPNDGFAVAGDLPAELKEAITAALVDIAGTPEGADLLASLYEIDGLQPVESADFDVIRELRTELADLLE